MSNKNTATLPLKRRGRTREKESYADWMARIDHEVSVMARKKEREPPTFADLHPAQRKITQLLIEHMRSLPLLNGGENGSKKSEYQVVKRFLIGLLELKYPKRTWGEDGSQMVAGIPDEERDEYWWMLRNCAGHAAPVSTCLDDEDLPN